MSDPDTSKNLSDLLPCVSFKMERQSKGILDTLEVLHIGTQRFLFGTKSIDGYDLVTDGNTDQKWDIYDNQVGGK